MFICLDCGSSFDEPEYFYDFHGMETPPYEVYKGCPGCGGAYTDAITCSICGEYILDEVRRRCRRAKHLRKLLYKTER